MSTGHAFSRDELIRTLTVHTGIATADGAVGGTTIIDSALVGRNDFITNKTVLIMTGPAAFEDRGVLSFSPATGVITLVSGFSAQILSGTVYRIVNLSSVEVQIAQMQASLVHLPSLTRVQRGSQATTATLAVVGAAIEHTIPFKVSGWLSLHNMVAGDTFLVIEEIRDQDDITYREFGRTSYSGVQVSPLLLFTEKACQGWRVRIQRTAGLDRAVSFQFFQEVRIA